MRTPKKPIIISYRDLSHCKKPEYLPEYSAHCWGQCKPDLSCSSPPTAEDISAKRLVIYYENGELINSIQTLIIDVFRDKSRLRLVVSSLYFDLVSHLDYSIVNQNELDTIDISLLLIQCVRYTTSQIPSQKH